MDRACKISVVTVNLNNRAGLQRTVESVLNQVVQPFEFIIIDGGSNDGSEELLEEYSARLTYSVSEKDSGIYNGMNKGLSKATGDYLLFLNSGDNLYDHSVLGQVSPLLGDHDVVSGDIMMHFENELHHIHSDDYINLPLFRRLSLYHQATFIRKTLFDTYGHYDESFRIVGDFEFFMRVLLRNSCTYKHIPVIICVYHTDGISNNKSYLELINQERERAWRRNFSTTVLNAIDELYAIRKSKFYWIINKTRKKGFFYFYFSVLTAVLLSGYRMLKFFRLVK
jgi:glycosyltransferase involved in cell wall biosynthesis